MPKTRNQPSQEVYYCCCRYCSIINSISPGLTSGMYRYVRKLWMGSVRPWVEL